MSTAAALFTVKTRLTAAELEELRRLAAGEDRSVSAYLRRLIVGELHAARSEALEGDHAA